MEDSRKGALVSPSAEWIRDYQGTLDPQNQQHRPGRRRRRRRRASNRPRPRQRLLRTVLVCSALLLAMAAALYLTLSREPTAAAAIVAP
jgi:hypothetical protein